MNYTLTYRDGNGKIHCQRYSEINQTALNAIVAGFSSGAEFVNIEAGHGFGDDIASM